MNAAQTAGAVVVAAGGVATVYGGAKAIAHTIRFFARLGRNVSDLVDDWRGEPARPGVPARLGMMERVGAVELALQTVDERQAATEAAMAATQEAVAEIRAQLHPNGGGSVRDALDRIERHVGKPTPVHVSVAAPAAVSPEGASHA